MNSGIFLPRRQVGNDAENSGSVELRVGSATEFKRVASKRTRRDPLQDIRFFNVENGKHNATFLRSLQLSFAANKRGPTWLKDQQETQNRRFTNMPVRQRWRN